jgi:hypothetical protein
MVQKVIIPFSVKIRILTQSFDVEPIDESCGHTVANHLEVVTIRHGHGPNHADRNWYAHACRMFFHKERKHPWVD